MEKITFQVNKKKIILHISIKAMQDFMHMKNIKTLKHRIRVAINNNESDLICRYNFISNYLNYNDYKLIRLTNNEFIIEKE